MDASTFDLFHQGQRILCKCPNPNCGEISRLSKIRIKSGKKSKPTWLDEYEKSMKAVSYTHLTLPTNREV